MIILLLGMCAFRADAQVTILTDDPSYTGLLGVQGGDAAITFGVQNTNTTVRILTEVAASWDVFFTASGTANVSLWVSTASLGGAPTIGAPDWTVVGTGTVTGVIGGTGIIPTFTGLAISLAPNTQYRFAIESSNGIAYSPAAATPNIFSNDGVNLQTSNFQLQGANVGFAGAFPTPPNSPRGFTGSITFQSNNAPCSGPPVPGAAVSSVAAACPTIPFSLSLQTPLQLQGLTYQWQSSSSGTAGSYSDIGGATNATLTTTLTAATYYQLLVSCSGGTAVASDPVLVGLSTACYCIPTVSDCTDGDVITNVTVGTLNNSSVCSTDGYIDYSLDATVVVPDVVQGIANTIAVTAGGGLYDEFVAVWIDYDHSGTFEASEFTSIGTTAGGTLNANINIPASALTGPTRMRVRVQFFNPFAAADGCTSAFLDFGETEDYAVNIIPCIQGAFITQPANVSASCGGDATFSTTAIGTNLTYQWQQQAGTSAPWTDLVDGSDVSGATTSSVTLSNTTTALNGNNYRVLISGGCTAIDFSNTASLTITPKVIDVSPVSYSTCTPIPAGSPVPLAITTSAGGTVSTTTSYPSGPINLLVPDLADGVGVTTSVTVPPLPAGAVITGASVTLNATHTYVGDLIIALKAPNGQVFNLDYALNATGGPTAGTTGFVNTVISSTGTQTLDLGTDPWTGTFAPDAVTTVQAGFPSAAATALIASGNPTATSFSGLYSVPDGTWTLGLYDYATPDEGTLTNWTLTLTYAVSSSAPLAGVWSPLTGLFLDAAGTIPYNGTVENTVYAAPTVSTDYTVTVNTGACPSDPVVIPVTIGTPIGAIVEQPQDLAACEGETVTFTSDVAAGSSGTYQWQVSNDAGVTFTDIGGANSSTLTLTSVSSSDNGNQYQLVVTSIACPDFVVSDAATLTVNSLPSVTITAAPYLSIYPGLRTLLTANVTPPATAQTQYQWFYNGAAITGATSGTIEVSFGNSGNGAFSVQVSNPSVCGAFASAEITISDSASNSLFIWPNPSSGQIQVRFNDGLTDITAGSPFLTVFDSKGARVFSQNYTVVAPYGRMNIDLSNQAKGTYIVVLYSASGNFVKSARVVIR